MANDFGLKIGIDGEREPLFMRPAPCLAAGRNKAALYGQAVNETAGSSGKLPAVIMILLVYSL